MTARTLQTSSLLVAMVLTGLMAGVFGLYSHTVMRGLGKTDDRAFVAAFQTLDRAIINPLFVFTFFGALVFSGVGCAMTLRQDGRTLLPWVATAAGLYLVVVLISMTIHVPLNDAIKAAGDVDTAADAARVRADFHETRWVVWNTVRAIATTVGFVCLAWALVLDGRSHRSPSSEAAPIPATAQPLDRPPHPPTP